MNLDKEKSKQLTELTKTLIKANGGSYEEWLYSQHLDYVTKNSDVLIRALTIKGDK